MKTLLLTILALISLQLNAQTWVQVPDANFQTYLTAHYPAAAFMTSGGNFYVDSDHAAIQAETYLDVSGLNISSIEGVQAFGNLETLVCTNNLLTTLPPLMSTLKGLHCYHNQLTVLPYLPDLLIDLNCSYNQLTSLPASVTLCSQLFNLICTNNQLTQLPPLPSSINFLECGMNQLTSLPAILPTQLIEFACDHNQLSVIPNLPLGLQYFYCQSNQLTALPSLPDSLKSLICEYNQLTMLPSLPTGFLYLNCIGNQLTSLPILPDGLAELACNENQLTELSELPDSLAYLTCTNNQISCFAPFPTTLVYLYISNNNFTCLPNYIPAMDSATLAYPLCNENDPVNNPNGCDAASGLEGLVFNDVNNNCISTGNLLTYIPMNMTDSSGNVITSSTSLANGNYFFTSGSGTYELSINTMNLTPVLQVTCPAGNSSSTTVSVSDTVVSGGDFGLVCNGFDLGVQSVVSSGWFFPGQTHGLSILAGDLTAQYNMHCATGISGEVAISVTGPGTVTFWGAPTNVSGNVAVYSIADFGAVNVNSFLATILTDTTAQAGEEFCVTVSVATNASGELDATNNLYTYCYEVVNSYDPNIKETYPEVVEPGYTDEFTYTIHFQNTGNAPAVNIRLADALDPNLDLSTFKVVNASHAFSTTVNAASRLLTVRFPNIMLPDSASDAEGSIGYIQYRVKPLAGLTNGTIIHNTAFIYFDYNAPIVTNTSENLFSEPAGLDESVAETIQLYPNPSDNHVFVRSENSTIEQVFLYDLNGTLVKQLTPNMKQTSIDVSDLQSGVYLATVQTNQSVVTKRLIVR